MSDTKPKKRWRIASDPSGTLRGIGVIEAHTKSEARAEVKRLSGKKILPMWLRLELVPGLPAAPQEGEGDGRV